MYTGRVAGRQARDFSGDESKRAIAAGALLDDPEMRKIAFDTLTGAKGADDRMNTTIANLKGLAAERGGIDKLSVDEAGHLGALQSIQTAGELERIAGARGGRDKLTESDWKSLIAKRKAAVSAQNGDPSTVTKESILAQSNSTRGMAAAQQEEIVRTVANQVGRDSTQEIQLMRAGGIAKYSKTNVHGGSFETLTLTDETRASLRKGGGEGAVQAAEMALQVQTLGIAAGKATSVEEQRALLAQVAEKSGNLYDTMGGMDVKSLKAFGASMAGTTPGGQATELIMRGQSIEAGKRKGGAAGAIASQLGLQLSAEDIAGLKGKDAKSAAAALAGRLGVGGDENFMASLEDSIAAAGKKGGGIKAGSLLHRAMEGASKDTKDKLAEMAKGNQSPDEKILDKLSEGNKFLETMVKYGLGTKAALDAINNKTKAPDAEKP